MSIEASLKEFKEIQERFLPSEKSDVEPEKDEISEPEEFETKEDEISDETSDEVIHKEIDDIEGETSDSIADALDMLLSVIVASSERVKKIVNQVIADDSVELNEVLTTDVIDKLGSAISDLSDIESDIASIEYDEEEKIEDLVDEPDEGEIVPGDEPETHQGE